MLDKSAYLDSVRRDGERIADLSEAHLDEPVPSCPGNTVASLLLHVAGFCLYVAQRAEDDDVREPDVSTFGTDVMVGFRREHAHLMRALTARDPDETATTWGTDQHARFWFRRAAQELCVHRWDFENALTEPGSIDPALAVDGVDEYLHEFFAARVATLFGGSGETFCFDATDSSETWTFTMRPDVIEVKRDVDTADVSATGTASDVLLFLWGRVAPDVLRASGDQSLLRRWQDRVKL